MLCDGVWKNVNDEDARTKATSRLTSRAYVTCVALFAVLAVGCGTHRTHLVQIRTATGAPDERGRRVSGTGWVYDSRRGLIVTAYHVVNGSIGTTVSVEGHT